MAFIQQLQPTLPQRAPAAVMTALATSLIGEAIGAKTNKSQAVTPARRKLRPEERERFPVEAGESERGGAARPVAAVEAEDTDPWAVLPAVGPHLAFLAQRIAQELLGDGIHIEPWKSMIDAYAKRLELQAMAIGSAARRLDFNW